MFQLIVSPSQKIVLFLIPIIVEVEAMLQPASRPSPLSPSPLFFRSKAWVGALFYASCNARETRVDILLLEGIQTLLSLLVRRFKVLSKLVDSAAQPGITPSIHIGVEDRVWISIVRIAFPSQREGVVVQRIHD